MVYHPAPNLRINKMTWGVKHSEITRWSSESLYKSHCPVEGCEGILLVNRDIHTGQLQAKDHCLLCGQQVIYIDIGIMQRREREE